MIEQLGERIAALGHDATMLDDPALSDAVASAARLALSNVRLRAKVRRQVAELDASRRRILEARDAQRRRLQQELRAGAGQRLKEGKYAHAARADVAARADGALVTVLVADDGVGGADPSAGA